MENSKGSPRKEEGLLEREMCRRVPSPGWLPITRRLIEIPSVVPSYLVMIDSMTEFPRWIWSSGWFGGVLVGDLKKKRKRKKEKRKFQRVEEGGKRGYF